MSGPTELLVLRLGLIAIMFGFLALVALTMRGGQSRRLERPRSTAATSAAWHLVLLVPGDTRLARGTQFPLAGTMIIGRDPGAGIVIPDASVSLRHASITRTTGGWRVADLGSTNGTLVNGRPVERDGTPLRGDERITFGAVVLQLVNS